MPNPDRRAVLLRFEIEVEAFVDADMSRFGFWFFGGTQAIHRSDRGRFARLFFAFVVDEMDCSPVPLLAGC